MRRANWKWTTEDETALRDLAGKGLHLRAIAVRLRRSESSIKKRARDLKIAVRRPPKGRFRFGATSRAAPQR